MKSESHFKTEKHVGEARLVWIQILFILLDFLILESCIKIATDHVLYLQNDTLK